MSGTLHRNSRSQYQSIAGAEAAAVYSDVQRFVTDTLEPASALDMKRKVLSCYPDYALLTIALRDTDRPILLGLYAPGDFWPLDQAAIDNVNRLAPLHLNKDTVHDYIDLCFAWHPGDQPTHHAAERDDGTFQVEAAGHPDRIVSRSGRITPPIDIRPLAHVRAFPRVRAIAGVRAWTAVDPKSTEMTRLLKAVDVDEVPAIRLRARKADVSFYRTHSIYELLAWRTGVQHIQQYYFIHHPDGIVRPLDGDTRLIHDINRIEPPQFATGKDAADYLRFFCWATRAIEGRFHVVERIRDISWDDAPPGDVRDKILAQLKPVSADRAGANWECSATLAYGNHLFLASFTIPPDGAVEMIEDSRLVDKALPIRETEPSRLTVRSTLTDHDLPSTYLDSESAPPNDPATPLVDCSAAQVLEMLGLHHDDAR
jgi:hypothetical protein